MLLLNRSIPKYVQHRRVPLSHRDFFFFFLFNVTCMYDDQSVAIKPSRIITIIGLSLYSSPNMHRHFVFRRIFFLRLKPDSHRYNVSNLLATAVGSHLVKDNLKIVIHR